MVPLLSHNLTVLLIAELRRFETDFTALNWALDEDYLMLVYICSLLSLFCTVACNFIDVTGVKEVKSGFKLGQAWLLLDSWTLGT